VGKDDLLDPLRSTPAKSTCGTPLAAHETAARAHARRPVSSETIPRGSSAKPVLWPGSDQHHHAARASLKRCADDRRTRAVG
jgi:hypothetical protein